MTNTVANELVGAAWPSVQPGTGPVLYGHVSLDPLGAFEARSLQTFRLVYTVGRYGIDDTGSIRVVFRFMGDWGALQISDPRDTTMLPPKPALVRVFLSIMPTLVISVHGSRP